MASIIHKSTIASIISKLFLLFATFYVRASNNRRGARVGSRLAVSQPQPRAQPFVAWGLKITCRYNDLTPLRL